MDLLSFLAGEIRTKVSADLLAVLLRGGKDETLAASSVPV